MLTYSPQHTQRKYDNSCLPGNCSLIRKVKHKIELKKDIRLSSGNCNGSENREDDMDYSIRSTEGRLQLRLEES